MATHQQKRIAVIGAGVAGITAAHLLQRTAQVKLFEKNKRLGGHTHTVVIDDGPDAGIGVDTGFIVLNDKTYPLFHALLKDLDCTPRFSDMSFGYYSERDGFHYAGTNLSGLFAQRSNILRPSFYRFLSEIVRFGKRALSDLDLNTVGNMSLGEYVRDLSPMTVNRYVVPMAAAIWSATQQDILAFPSRTLLHFWRNHGLLSLSDRPRWQTVSGGSHSYVKSFARSFCGQIAVEASIRHIRRTDEDICVVHKDGYEESFDEVVVATHADEALRLLENPSAEEIELLGAWRYQENRALLHTDVSFMPSRRRAWASWNYVERIGTRSDTPVPVTYYMNRLQGLRTHDDYMVTLNSDRQPAPGTQIKEIIYHHPVYTNEAVATQKRLPSLNGRQRTWFCGSYFGYGFHEDAVRSGVAVANSFGIDL